MQNVRATTRTAAASVAAVIGAVGIGLAGAGPASAERWEKQDPRFDADHGDIVRVRADHEPKNLWVRATFRQIPYDYTTVAIDTDRKRPGPEFRAEGFHSWEGIGFDIRRIGSGYEPCSGGRTVRLNRSQVQLKIPRACLRTNGVKPRQVRIRVESRAEELSWIVDAVPGKKLFGPWLSVG